MNRAQPYSKSALYARQKQRRFDGKDAIQVAMPIGGIGAGCVCLNAQGGLQDFSIRNTPDTTALADAHHPTDSAFAAVYFPELGVARMVQGPMPKGRIYDQGLKGQGLGSSGHQGLPRFRNASFQGEYPFGMVDLSDPGLPLAVRITGFNPFIPLDDKNSSLPCAILEYTFTNPTTQPVPFEFSYHLSHFAYGSGYDYSHTRNAVIPEAGVSLFNVEGDRNAPTYGSCALGVVNHVPQIKAMWFRGGWFDGISVLWKEISTGTFTTNDGAKAAESNRRNGGSVLVKHSLAPGGSVTIPVVIAWYFPNVHYAYGEARPAGEADAWSYAEHGNGEQDPDCGPDCECHTKPPRWKPYYSTQWKDARDVLLYVRRSYADLRGRTQAFHDALFSASLPAYVLDAVSANLAIIKSPTVLRQANGNVWAWEGCFSTSGCCHGSCTHVWNYAQAIAHLFPQLERSLREQELERSMETEPEAGKQGHISFRSALPDGPAPHNFHAASDGQLGGIMKAYREYTISGDRDWLAGLYPALKLSIDYCIATWDPDRLGVLVEPHHNTYDIEFWGPDGMCTSFYLGALAAMDAIATALGKPAEAAAYRELGQRGALYLDQHLFNGEYYAQKVTLSGLRASPSEEQLAKLRESNPEEYALLMSEGPKYQYGAGCISDGVFGAWLARLCGVETFQSRDNIRKNLQAIFDYNFKPSLWEHANTQRPGYAMGDEPGLLLCTWPHGGKPTLPFVYSDEVWTGIEYQAAAHMIAEGLVDEGLTVVKALRSRYDGLTRNPWNEYECGNYYARAMASYALLIALSGFRYNAAEKTLFLKPQLSERPFKTFFSTASGWGTITLGEKAITLQVIEGELDVEKIVLAQNGETREIQVAAQVKGTKRIGIG
jgi:uncharacterized protein (DUF608 family)